MQAVAFDEIFVKFLSDERNKRVHHIVRTCIYFFIRRCMMDSPDSKMPISAIEASSGLQMTDPDVPSESQSPIRTDRLYQIAAVTAGLFFLATAL